MRSEQIFHLFLEPISKSFEENREAGESQECGAAIESRQRTVRPTSVWYIVEVGAHLAQRTCGDWAGPGDH
jgi:hypothetical protein